MPQRFHGIQDWFAELERVFEKGRFRGNVLPGKRLHPSRPLPRPRAAYPGSALTSAKRRFQGHTSWEEWPQTRIWLPLS